MDPVVFICPSTDDVPAKGPTTRDIEDEFASGGHDSYVYLAKGLNLRKVGAQQVLAFESLQNHTRDNPGMHVLVGDGSVEFVQGEPAQRLTEKLRLEENPPTGWR